MSRQSGSVTGKSAPQLPRVRQQAVFCPVACPCGRSVTKQLCTNVMKSFACQLAWPPPGKPSSQQSLAESGKLPCVCWAPPDRRSTLRASGSTTRGFLIAKSWIMMTDVKKKFSHRLVSCSFRFHFRVRGPLKYGGVRTGELPDSCSGLTTAWPGQLRQLDITVL